MNAPLTIQYLGQAGFLITDGSATLVIDPYLSDAVDRLPGFPPGFWKRAYPPPVQAEELANVDLLLCSHDHLDHTDPETLRGLSGAAPHCRFAGPCQTVELMQKIGLPSERITTLDADKPFSWPGGMIEPIAAAHEDYETDGQGHHRYLGFLLRWKEATFYHAGDTVLTPELSARLSRERIDIAFLPMNGGDDTRRALDIVGNMDVAAAARFAVEQKFGMVVPMHCDLYANNGRSAVSIAAEWKASPAEKDIPLKFFRPGESLSWTRV